MKIKITVESEYTLPAEFGLDQENMSIFHKDNPDIKYEPDFLISFLEDPESVTEEKEGIDQMSEELQKKFDEGFEESQHDIKVIEDDDN